MFYSTSHRIPFAAKATAAFLLLSSTSVAHAADTALDAAVHETLKQCQAISTSCASTTKGSAAMLVFPEVVKADLLIGGAGGKGALVESGKITGYYNIGAASAGLQAGVERASQIYVFRNATALSKLKTDGAWNAGATANVTLVDADANKRETTGDVLAYVFDGEGLHAGIGLDVFRVWESSKTRPE